MTTKSPKWLMFSIIIIGQVIMLFTFIYYVNEANKLYKHLIKSWGGTHDSDWTLYLYGIGLFVFFGFLIFIYIFKVDDKRQKLIGPFMIVIGASSFFLPDFQYRTRITLIPLAHIDRLALSFTKRIRAAERSASYL